MGSDREMYIYSPKIESRWVRSTCNLLVSSIPILQTELPRFGKAICARPPSQCDTCSGYDFHVGLLQSANLDEVQHSISRKTNRDLRAWQGKYESGDSCSLSRSPKMQT